MAKKYILKVPEKYFLRPEQVGRFEEKFKTFLEKHELDVFALPDNIKIIQIDEEGKMVEVSVMEL